MTNKIKQDNNLKYANSSTSRYEPQICSNLDIYTFNIIQNRQSTDSALFSEVCKLLR